MSKTPAAAGVVLAPEDIEKAIAYLQGRRDEDEDLTHVIRYKDVLKWLKIHRRTLDYYIQRGYLKRVYGGGETRHRRFAGQLPQVHRKAVGKMRGGALRFASLIFGVSCVR